MLHYITTVLVCLCLCVCLLVAITEKLRSFKKKFIWRVGDVVALLAGQWTCDSQVAGSSPGRSPLHSGHGQATYSCVPLSPSSIIWYRPREVISLAGKVTACVVESNDSLPPGL